MKPIIKCKECNKKKEHYAKGMCLNCYKRTQYQKLPKKEKLRRYKIHLKYRKKNIEKIRKWSREYQRKKKNIKKKNFRK